MQNYINIICHIHIIVLINIQKATTYAFFLSHALKKDKLHVSAVGISRHLACLTKNSQIWWHKGYFYAAAVSSGTGIACKPTTVREK